MKIAVVGAGTVGTALAVRWREAGHEIVGVSGREATPERAAAFLPGVPVTADTDAATAAEVIVLGTPDDVIEDACKALAAAGVLGEGQSVAHLSGATGLTALTSARTAGASVLSLHPLQTFPTVQAAIDRVPGCAIAVTTAPGDSAAMLLGEQLATDAGGRPVVVGDDMKPLYHAAAVFASNYLVTVMAEAEQLFLAAGLNDPIDLFMPLARASLENVAALGPETALTGPAVRGDAGTVSRNLQALSKHAPDAISAYVALAGIALDVGERSGRLSAESREAVERVLAKWK